MTQLEIEQKADAMLAEISSQRNHAMDRCVILRAEIVKLQNELNILKSQDKSV